MNLSAGRTSPAFQDAVLKAMQEGVVVVDAAGVVRETNPAAERLTGLLRKSAVGQPVEDVVRLEGVGAARVHPLRECLARRHELRGAVPDVLLPAGEAARLTVQWRALPLADGGALLLFEDVTASALLSEEIAYRSRHDLLTGLLNREEFEHRLRAALASARHDNARFLVGFLDLDQFRMINDTAGHFAGDEMLREIAALLRARLREGDVLARIGGDEFGFLLRDVDPAARQDRLDALLTVVRDHRFAWDARTYSVTGSMGVAILNSGSDSVARLMSDTDAACKAAKDGGRDRVRFADEGVAQRFGEMTLMGRFASALDANRFVLFAEDVVAVTPPHGVVYRELLVRWRDEEGRLIFPSSFIQVAERYFMITALDRWVVQHAFERLAKRPDDGVVYAVNLSGQSLADDKFLEFVLLQLERTRVAPSRVCFEITETATISRLSEAVRFIRRLSEAGVRFSLDDFGTGMASFSYLKSLAVHFLKIDGSFVQSMLESRLDRGMVEAINRIGHEIGLRTIAESVESRDLLPPLASIGVDFAQGRAIAEGRPLDDI